VIGGEVGLQKKRARITLRFRLGGGQRIQTDVSEAAQAT